MNTTRRCCLGLLAAGLLASGGSAPQAQETASPTAPVTTTTPAAEPAAPPAATRAPAPADDPAYAPEPAAGERVSADNNVSFPVDI